jgi:hypothetical protein
MDEKIKKLAVKTEGLIDYQSPQMIFDKLGDVARKQREYFEYLGPDNFIKLSIYIHSLKETNDFKLGEKILNNLMFSKLVTTEGNRHVSQCDECEGSGELNCEYCGGNEKINCETCEGSGELECPECDGDGRQMGDGEWEDCEACEGSGNGKCPDCGGEGYLSCDNCDNGKNECWECSGNGDVETTQLKYDAYLVATWNRDINRDFSLNENSQYPALSEYEFDRLRDEYIVLTYEDDNHAEFQDWVKINEVYCTFYSDEPKLNLTEKMRVDNRADSYEPDYYTT